MGYHTPEIVAEGQGSITTLPAAIKKTGVDKVLLVTGPRILKMEFTARLIKALDAEGVRYAVFSDMQANPTDENVEAGLKVFTETGCKGIIAFGGGSPMDCAKAIAARYARPKKSVEKLQGILKVHKKLVPVWAVPTTSGTGSETTCAAVITIAETHHKASINDPALFPAYVALDPELTKDLPPFVTATTGMDALCHAVEAYTNHTYNTKEENTRAKEAVKLIYDWLYPAFLDGNNLEAREKMQLAAFHAGRAFTRGCVGNVHAVGHGLSGLYGIPHGLAMAVICPHVMRQYGEKVTKRLAELADVCGISGNTEQEKADAFISWMEDINKKMDIPKTLSCIKREDYEQLAQWAEKEANPLYPVPVVWKKADYFRLLDTLRSPDSESAKEPPKTQDEVHAIVEQQRAFFKTNETLDVKWRIQQLKKLRSAVISWTARMQKALNEDLGRSEAEAYFCDIGAVVMEINEYIRGLRRWAKPERHSSGMLCFPSTKTKVYKMPYGVSLIISPFNFPFLLSIGVLAAAIAGGNTAVIKASSKSTECTAVLQNMIASTFPPEFVTVVNGGHDVADMCLAERFDKIFYTGSPAVGRHVLESAAGNLTPAALELGGETGNWAIVRKDADIKDAARKIAFFKICNAGQICININQAAVAKEVAEEFIKELKAAIVSQIGEQACENPEYPNLITDAAYEKCAKEAEQYRKRIVFGGTGNAKTRRYSPTIIYPVSADEPLVSHELFNPLLPVVPFKDDEIDTLLKTISEREHGLALYLFTRDMKWAEKTMQTQQYGGGCINEVCLHLMVKGVPFNGTGHSGMGAYHGIWGFREFTHPATVMYGKTRFNLPLREHPYEGKENAYKLKMIKRFEK